MDENQVKKIAQETYNENASSREFTVSPTSFHSHNGTDSQKINQKNIIPSPVSSVVDASIAPTDTPSIGTFRFLVDNKSGTPHWYFWSFLPNVKTNLPAWHYVALT